MKSYLSIDLDYWIRYLNDVASTRFFKRVFSLGLPIKVVESHERLLPHINKSNADVIYNVDYHSDIFGFKNEEEPKTWLKENKPEDGTWGVFIKWRKNGQFIWLYPDEMCFSRGQGTCWESESDNPFGDGFNEWKSVTYQKGTSKIDWKSITHVGVSLSPAFTEFETVERVMNAFRSRNVKFPEKGYEKGVEIKDFWINPLSLYKGWDILI